MSKYELSFIKRVAKCRITTVKDLKTDGSSISPSSERIEELWVVFCFYEDEEKLCHLRKYDNMNL